MIYRGPASSPGCPEAALRVVRAAGLTADYVGPGERRGLDKATLAACRVYVQPGGGELEEAWPHLAPARRLLRQFVTGGGAYIGFCLGAYLAGRDPGLGLLPGDTDQYIISPDAEIRHDRDTIVSLTWAGQPRQVFFQDGPVILVPESPHVDILATYQNGLCAAAVCRVGDGAVGVAGPHPEATPDWFTAIGLRPPPRDGRDLAIDLIRRTVASTAARSRRSV